MASSPSRRTRRTYKQIFLAKCAHLAGSDNGTVTNNRLRTELGWDTDRYDQIKSKLLSSREIENRAGGPGGSVQLTAALPKTLKAPAPLSVFVSYSHADTKIQKALALHLHPLQRLSYITSWHDRKIAAGEDFANKIDENLDRADIVLLLISIDFINSAYCYETEMTRALERDAKGDCRVIPIIVRPCIWDEAPFARLQSLPTEARAVSLWTNEDEALVDVAKGIRLVVDQMREAKKPK